MLRRILLLLVLALGATAFGLVHSLRQPVTRAVEPPVVLVVPAGANARTIAQQLVSLGLVDHPAIFQALVRWRGAGAQLRAGRYVFEGELTLDDILRQLRKGAVERHNITIPEGRNIEQLAEIARSRGISAERILELARDPAPIRDIDPEASDLEGYLFPDTYDVPLRDDPARSLVDAMLARFREVVAPLRPRLAATDLSLRELVTVASLVELETAQGSERPRIAAVFLNRLERRMLLQTDPTVIYALRMRGDYDGNIRKRDLDIDSPYNTYRYSGLPPGPIASPGREALQAVLHPASGDELYFVSRNDGTHHFSRTLREHERAVDRYQRRRRSVAKPSTG